MSLTRGAIVLCGGRSSRMGRDKAWLPFGPTETMLQRVVRLIAEAVPRENIVVVAAPGQSLPPLPPETQILHDAHPHRGPLAGLACGLKALQDRADAAFVCGCDTPLLVPAFASRLFDLLGTHEIAAVHDEQRLQPLPAVYRIDLVPRTEALLESGERSLTALVERSDAVRVPVKSLRGVDPELQSLATCNTLEEYHELLRTAIAMPHPQPDNG